MLLKYLHRHILKHVEIFFCELIFFDEPIWKRSYFSSLTEERGSMDDRPCGQVDIVVTSKIWWCGVNLQEYTRFYGHLKTWRHFCTVVQLLIHSYPREPPNRSRPLIFSCFNEFVQTSKFQARLWSSFSNTECSFLCLVGAVGSASVS